MTMGVLKSPSNWTGFHPETILWTTVSRGPFFWGGAFVFHCAQHDAPPATTRCKVPLFLLASNCPPLRPRRHPPPLPCEHSRWPRERPTKPKASSVSKPPSLMFQRRLRRHQKSQKSGKSLRIFKSYWQKRQWKTKWENTNPIFKGYKVHDVFFGAMFG